MKISVDVDELFLIRQGKTYSLHVSESDLQAVTEQYGGLRSRDKTEIGSIFFCKEPSITEELDRLLAQRSRGGKDDLLVMNRDVWQRFVAETGWKAPAVYTPNSPHYRGIPIAVRDEVEGGVQLKCDYYIKGNL